MLAAALAAILALFADPPSRLPAVDAGRFTLDERGAAVDGQVVQPSSPRRTLRIAIVPDRTTGRAWGMPYLRAGVADLQRIRPDAMFTIGDMVQGYTRDEATWEQEADEYIAAVRPLGADFYPTAGNHDVTPGSRQPSDRRYVERYRHRFGPLWYSVDFDLATVLVLYSDDGMSDSAVKISDAQLAWIEQALARAAQRNKPIVLLMHRPLWRYESARWNELVGPLLKRYGANAVIAGHFHSLQRDRDVDGVQYHIVGTCGGMIDQHPYAGQLQHLTFVDIDDAGAVRVWHQPVGLTLPEDFVVRDDEDRVFAISNGREVVTWKGALPDPSSRAIDDRVALVVRNPADVPVEVSAALVTGAPEPVPVGDEPWVTRTLIDARNPFVVDADTKFTVDPIAPITIPPKESREIPVHVRCPALTEPCAAPEVRVAFTFKDTHERLVPVWIRTIVPIGRVIAAGAGAPGAASPIQPWMPSPFDVLEPNPTLAASLDASGALALTVTITDDDRPDDDVVEPTGTARFTDPMHDAIRLRFSSGEEFFVEPFRRNAGVLAVREGRLEPTDRVTMEVLGDPKVAVVRLVCDPALAATATRADGGLNVGVADNDHTYHTQWRWLVGGDRWARVVGRPSSAASLP
ncbi:MAG: metallophosphoesterase [Phycisphaerales bacterium]